MKKILPYLMYIIMTFLIIYGHYYEITEFTDIAMWVTYVILLIASISICIPSKILFDKKDRKDKKYIRVFSFIFIGSLVITGHSIAASFWAIIWAIAQIKKGLWKDESNKKGR